jgi:hypothetical protein
MKSVVPLAGNERKKGKLMCPERVQNEITINVFQDKTGLKLLRTEFQGKNSRCFKY